MKNNVWNQSNQLGTVYWLYLFYPVLWYLSVTLLAFIHQKRKRHTLFEDDQFIPVEAGGFNPISVSSKDLPSELIPVRLSEDIALPASLYEEIGLDDGYSIDTFSKPRSSGTAKKFWRKFRFNHKSIQLFIH